MLEKNMRVRGTIEGYSAEGLGIMRVDGQVVFVQRALRGEVCDVLVMKVRKNAAFGKIVRLLVPSMHRVTPDCPHFGCCGGCDMRHMDYEEELFAKRQRVQDALTRLGGSSVQISQILPALDTARYRNKSLYPIGADGSVGFYRARSHDVQDIPVCRLQKQNADLAAEALRHYIAETGVSCYEETARRGLLRHLFVRTNTAGESLVCLVVNGEGLPQEERLVSLFRAQLPACVGVLLCTNTRDTNVALGDSYRTLWGQDTLCDTLCGLTFRLSVPSFYQINREQAQCLYSKALEYADLHGTETVLDLYCGAGTITQVMARAAKEAVGAEIVPEAIRDAKENAARNGIENVSFFCGDASAVAADFAVRGLHPDVICVDPPRKGLAEEVVDAVVQMQPQRVVYVSCDPATLGRDVKRFSQRGYTLREATAVDMFPRTHHVECVALLTKTHN